MAGSTRWLGFPVAALLLGTGCGKATAPPAPKPCNGSVDNCSRHYNEVTYGGTHDAFAYAEGGPVSYTMPNQDLPIPQQLAAGFRAVGIRPCPYTGNDETQKDVVYVTHNYSQLHGAIGQEPLLDVLTEVHDFLVANPREVVTLLAESSVTPQQIAPVFTQAGLDPFLYTHDKTKGWPTLQEMIDTEKRLVVFNDSQDPTRPPWQLYMWDYIVDTDYNITDKSQFKCDFYRGQASNDLYFLNEFIYKDYGGGIVTADQGNASIANDESFAEQRARQCWKQTGRYPNFIYVDFFAQGNAMGAVTALNATPR